MAYIIQWRMRGYRVGRDRYPAEWVTIDDTGYSKEEAEECIKEMAKIDDKNPEIWGYDNITNYRVKFVSQN